MKKQLITVAAAITLAISLVGCATSVRDNVPATQITGQLGGAPFSFTGPKNLIMTNFVAEADSNGTVRVAIGYLQAQTDPNVIQMTGSAYSSMRAADSALINSAISQMGQTAGSAAK